MTDWNAIKDFIERNGIPAIVGAAVTAIGSAMVNKTMPRSMRDQLIAEAAQKIADANAKTLDNMNSVIERLEGDIERIKKESNECKKALKIFREKFPEAGKPKIKNKKPLK